MFFFHLVQFATNMYRSTWPAQLQFQFKTVKEKDIDLQKKRSFAVKVDDAMNFSVYQFCILNEIYLQVIVNAIVREFIEANIYEGQKILI